MRSRIGTTCGTATQHATDHLLIRALPVTFWSRLHGDSVSVGDPPTGRSVTAGSLVSCRLRVWAQTSRGSGLALRRGDGSEELPSPRCR